MNLISDLVTHLRRADGASHSIDDQIRELLLSPQATSDLWARSYTGSLSAAMELADFMLASPRTIKTTYVESDQTNLATVQIWPNGGSERLDFEEIHVDVAIGVLIATLRAYEAQKARLS